MEVMLGDKLMEMMLLLIQPSMPINSDMVLFKEILIPMLVIIELLVFLI